jgi:aspartate aminotransferase-like enzyme
MRISNGYGPLKNKTFRIATMGETTLEDVDALLAAMDDYLATVEVNPPAGRSNPSGDS